MPVGDEPAHLNNGGRVGGARKGRVQGAPRPGNCAFGLIPHMLQLRLRRCDRGAGGAESGYLSPLRALLLTAPLGYARQVRGAAARGCALAGKCIKDGFLCGSQKQEAAFGHHLHTNERISCIFPKRRGTFRLRCGVKATAAAKGNSCRTARTFATARNQAGAGFNPACFKCL